MSDFLERIVGLKDVKNAKIRQLREQAIMDNKLDAMGKECGSTVINFLMRVREMNRDLQYKLVHAGVMEKIELIKNDIEDSRNLYAVMERDVFSGGDGLADQCRRLREF